MTIKNQPSQLENQLNILHGISLELMQNHNLDILLNQIADFACNSVGASYTIVSIQKGENGTGKCVTRLQDDCRPFQEPVSNYCRELETLFHIDPSPQQFLDIHKFDSCPKINSFFELPTPFLGLPLYRGNELLGGIYLLGRENGAQFSMDDQHVLEILATYAAIGISNTRLNKKLLKHDSLLKQHNESLSLLTTLTATMSESSDIEETLKQLLQQLMSYLHIDVGEIYLRQEEGWLLKLLFHMGKSDEPLWGQKHIRYGNGPVGLTARNAKPQSATLYNHQLCNCETSSNGEACDFIINCYPLLGQSDVFGVLVVGNCEIQPIDEREDDFLRSISAWLGVLIENQRLVEQRQRLAVLEERERIGMDLHDGVIQSIYAVGLTLEHIRMIMKDDPLKAREVLNQAIRELNSTIRDIRLYIFDLRPRKLQDEDLTAGIKRLVNEFRVNALVNVNYSGPDEGAPELTQNQAVALFHICQEALANVAKHGNATDVHLNVWKTPERLLMEIHDDGRGFKVNDAKFSLGHGLSNMQTRGNNAGGEVEITSARGKGTTILAWVPINQSQEENY
ncbi:MAG: GAF domain-containing protein [Anaerolineaceae bacterium]|nr:GAF domain-containing protein [Anaerolineaceae bacterium]